MFLLRLQALSCDLRQRLTVEQVALKSRGIDKLLDEAREDNKENDVRLTTPKSKSASATLDHID